MLLSHQKHNGFCTTSGTLDFFIAHAPEFPFIKISVHPIRMQDHAFIEPDLEEAMFQINFLHRNFYKPGITDRDISLISIRMNRSAEFLAQYGMNNLKAFDKIPSMLGSLQDTLNRDLGLGRPFPERDMQDNFGMGEVLDLSPPSQDL